MMKKTIIGIIIAIIIIFLGIVTYLYFNKPSDNKDVLNDMENEINNTTKDIDSIDQKESDEEGAINADDKDATSNDKDAVMQELQTELDGIDTDLNNMDNAETNLDSATK